MKILVVDDQSTICKFLTKNLIKNGYSCDYLLDGEHLMELLQEKSYDLVIMDVKMPRSNGIELLKSIKSSENLRNIKVVLMTAYHESDIAIESMKHGAFDYLVKPFEFEEVLGILHKMDKENIDYFCLSPSDDCKDKFVCKSKSMVSILKSIGQIANTDIPVLIIGETGTGKELVARALHNYSGRKNQKMVSLNCSAIPSELLESELFGYEKGAFSGADSRIMGKIELANNGTLFLDEIGDMNLELQAKLLRVLQDKSFYRLGGNTLISVNIRVISATNKDIETMVEKNLFRRDLFYRLSGFLIKIPPLRDRTEDIDPLLEHFVKKYSKQKIHINRDFIKKLMEYEFPGNVRELENIVRLSIVKGEFDMDLKSDSTNNISNFKNMLPSEIRPLSTMVKEFQKRYVENVYKACGCNQVKTSEKLKISRNTLRKILGLDG